jgi:hypothetical protein
MKRIDPTTFYTTKELRDILRGFVSLETLRVHGLVGSPGSGYWGQNAVDSLNRYWDHLSCQRGMGKVEKEKHLDEESKVFDIRNTEIQNGQVHSAPGNPQPLEGQRQKFRRLVSKDAL